MSFCCIFHLHGSGFFQRESTRSVEFFIYDTPKIFMLMRLVVFGIGVVRSFFSPESTRKLLAGKRELYGTVMAAFFGILTPFCTCSAVPLFIGFVAAGIPLGVTFSYLISAPLVNEIALILLYGLFGWKVAAVYLSMGLLIAMVSGWILGRLKMENHLGDLIECPLVNVIRCDPLTETVSDVGRKIVVDPRGIIRPADLPGPVPQPRILTRERIVVRRDFHIAFAVDLVGSRGNARAELFCLDLEAHRRAVRHNQPRIDDRGIRGPRYFIGHGESVRVLGDPANANIPGTISESRGPVVNRYGPHVRFVGLALDLNSRCIDPRAAVRLHVDHEIYRGAHHIAIVLMLLEQGSKSQIDAERVHIARFDCPYNPAAYLGHGHANGHFALDFIKRQRGLIGQAESFPIPRTGEVVSAVRVHQGGIVEEYRLPSVYKAADLPFAEKVHDPGNGLAFKVIGFFICRVRRAAAGLGTSTRTFYLEHRHPSYGFQIVLACVTTSIV
ncbi:MAG: permease [Desulfobacteraceae bacterium]|nr:permease [Desulfobacteraceae bacterium]